MPRVLLLHRSEGGAFLEHDLFAFGIEVESAPLTEAEAALAQSDADALIVEAATNLEETKRLLDLPYVLSARILSPDGMQIEVETRAPESFYDQFPEIVLSEGFVVSRFESPDNNLESVFRYLVGG